MQEPTRDVVDVERMATGGEAVARLADGCVLFVAGAVPGQLPKELLNDIAVVGRELLT